MPVVAVTVYVLLAVAVGWLGRHRAIGFIGFVIVALLFTPILVALILVISTPAREVERVVYRDAPPVVAKKSFFSKVADRF